MSKTYTFSTSPGFTDLSTNVTLVNSDITAQITSQTLLSLTVVGNTIECKFNGTLSASDIQKLQGIFNTRDVIPIDTLYRTVSTYFPKDDTVQSNSPSFKNLGSFSYNTFKLGSIGAVSVLSYNDSGAVSHTVQVVDSATNNIVAQGTFTNTVPLNNVMTVLYQPSSIQSILQVSMKCTPPSGQKSYNAYLEELTILQ